MLLEVLFSVRRQINSSSLHGRVRILLDNQFEFISFYQIDH